MFVENFICSAIFIRTKFWVSKKKHFFFFSFKNLHTKCPFFPTKSCNFLFRWDFLLKFFAFEYLRIIYFVYGKFYTLCYFYQDEKCYFLNVLFFTIKKREITSNLFFYQLPTNIQLHIHIKSNNNTVALQ